METLKEAIKKAKERRACQKDNDVLQNVDPDKVLLFAVNEYGATENRPLRLGNVDFWVAGDGPWQGDLIHSPSTLNWDCPAVQGDLNAFLESRWERMLEFLGIRAST